MLSNVSLRESNYLYRAQSSSSSEIDSPSEMKGGIAISGNKESDKQKDRKEISEESKVKSKNNSASQDLTEEEEKQVKELKQIDAEVRRHEQAHLAAGGSLVRGGASFSYQRGPDGQQYAVSGEVNIEMAPVDGDPEATIQKMQQVKSAALAPAEPSAQDRSVASRASSIEAQARSEMLSEQSNSSSVESDFNKSDKSETNAIEKSEVKENDGDSDDSKQNNKYSTGSTMESLKQAYLFSDTHLNLVNAYA